MTTQPNLQGVKQGHTAALIEQLRTMKECFRFALLSTTPEIARDGMVLIREAEAVLAAVEASPQLEASPR